MQTDKYQEVRDWEEELIKLLAIYRKKTAGRIITEDYTDSFPEQIVKDFIRSLMQQRDRELVRMIKEANQEQKDLMAKQVDTQEWWERTIDEAANENMDNSFLEPISKTGAEVLKGFIGSIVAETKIKTVEEMIQKINKLLIPQAYKDKNQTMWNTAIREVINLLESNE
jgi:hypothetical protein